MGLITNLPEDLPGTPNDLDNIVDPDQPPQASGERAEIYLSGAHVATLDNAPAGRERITMMVELEVVEESIRFTENGETEVPIRRCRRIGDMWKPGSQRPPTKEELAEEQARAKAIAAREKAEREEAERAEAEENEPPMFDEDGEPISDDAPRPDVDEDSAEVVHPDQREDQDEGDQVDESTEPDPTVVQFSDAKGGKR